MIIGLISLFMWVVPIHANAAAAVTLTLSAESVLPGDTVTASGTADPETKVSIKILGGAQYKDVVYYAAKKSDLNGNYTHEFKVPQFSDSLLVVAGYGKNVQNKYLYYKTDGATPSDTEAPAWNQGTLRVSSITRTGLTLDWSGARDNVGVTGYRVYRGTTLLTASPVSATSYTVSDLTAGTEYTFKVEAGDKAGNWSSDGPSVTATTLTATVPSPGSSSGGGTAAPKAVVSTTGTAEVTPAAGGTVSLGDEASIEIPANALKGSNKIEVKIEKTTAPSVLSAGLKLAGSVYEFRVGGLSSYSFAKNVTITLSFDSSALEAGESLAIHYYDESLNQWVNIGGTVSGNTVTVQVDHFTKFAVMAVAGEKEKEQEPAPQKAVDLKDIAGHWAFDSINELVSRGAIAGYPDGSFKPDNTITRAEFTTVLVKAFPPASQQSKSFADTAGHWAEDYIAAAAAGGLVSGYDSDTFAPDDLITREQMAVMIVRAAGHSPAAGETSFADRGSISDWAREAMATAVENGIMKGYPDHTVRPKANATRAEAVTVIAHALNK